MGLWFFAPPVVFSFLINTSIYKIRNVCCSVAKREEDSQLHTELVRKCWVKMKFLSDNF